jgi:hypothetical protein
LGRDIAPTCWSLRSVSSWRNWCIRGELFASHRLDRGDCGGAVQSLTAKTPRAPRGGDE